MPNSNPERGGTWLEFPSPLDGSTRMSVERRLDDAGIEFRMQTVSTMGSAPYTAGRFKYTLSFPAASAAPVCKILRDVLCLRDPRDDTHHSGRCPACDTEFADAQSCPSCGLNFGAGFDPDDPRIVFIRKYGGFTDRDADQLDRVAADGADLARPLEIWFRIGVPDEQSGELVSNAATEAGYDTYDLEPWDGLWLCYCIRDMLATVETIADAVDELSALASPHGGWYVGWDTWGNADSEAPNDRDR